jgi:hypothetical protein
VTYCYRCPECGATRESDNRDWAEWCIDHDVVPLTSRRLVLMVRDYRAEAVMVGAIR